LVVEGKQIMDQVVEVPQQMEMVQVQLQHFLQEQLLVDMEVVVETKDQQVAQEHQHLLDQVAAAEE